MAATPISLSRPKRILLVDDSSYSHKTQTRWEDSENSPMAVTWNRTQTWDSKGQPKDNDND
jgi:hypothetical protein